MNFETIVIILGTLVLLCLIGYAKLVNDLIAEYHKFTFQILFQPIIFFVFYGYMLLMFTIGLVFWPFMFCIFIFYPIVISYSLLASNQNIWIEWAILAIALSASCFIVYKLKLNQGACRRLKVLLSRKFIIRLYY